MSERKTYETNPISMPTLLQTYLSRLLTNPEMSAIGITSIHQLAKACLSAYLRNIENAVPKYKREFQQSSEKSATITIATSQEMVDRIDLTLKTDMIRNTMWYSHRSHILNALFRILLEKHVREYQDKYKNIFDIDIGDLVEFRVGNEGR
jgi:hypothetical protein